MSLFRILEACIKPRLLVPAIRVNTIRELDFRGLRDAGYRGAVFDKDNCLTLPCKDTLVPQLKDAWEDCRTAFGKNNVIVVSNSAGTRDDPAGLEAESVSHHLRVPVLPHAAKKPGCLELLRNPISHSQQPIHPSELIYVGDRLFTDVVMGNKLGGLTVWTTGLWAREAMALRYLEYGMLRIIVKWQAFRNKQVDNVADERVVQSPQQRFVKPDPRQANPGPSTVARVWSCLVAALRLTSVVARWFGGLMSALYRRLLLAYRKQEDALRPRDSIETLSSQEPFSSGYHQPHLIVPNEPQGINRFAKLVVTVRDAVIWTTHRREAANGAPVPRER
ncbi:mitochondrial PGP phosphatase-domain-containing protein [Cantharellus anzutake]|uniref:mitochondrial PGP phosphatase-domain-containing protein n=1 Tax=Cantharellus anzutake TaxID=1750568 RepID=UPI00190733C0|nr:mitochondrial PGP phosphatase-domain-containing protein [Cantharellus anzutake]KAF8342941.1 mitochondrial PGP phosphatase-domain-containing protein [Cantharellus anzutake]